MRTRFVVVSAVFVVTAVVACNNSSPASPSPSATPTGQPAAAPQGGDAFGDVSITPIHHATFLMKAGGKNIYFDPVAADAKYDGLPKADYVFVTDIHPDHMDPAGLAKVKHDGTIVVAPPAVNEKMPAGVVMKNGDTHDFGTFKAEAVPMYNLQRGPSPGTFFHDKGRGNGYVLTVGTQRFYVSGDTECIPEMKALANIDVAFVCMNLPYTMPPSEAAQCIDAFKPKVVYPYHYRGSNLDELKVGAGIDVRKRTWY